MSEPIELNALESTRFGITAARLSDPNAPLEKVNQAASRLGVDMISVRIDAGKIDRVHRLQADDYRLMDTLVYYGRDLGGPQDEIPSPRVEIRPAQKQDSQEVAGIAAAAFAGYMGHYHTDPRLDNAAADAAYVEWAENSIKNLTPEAPALVAVADKDIAGFLTLRRNTPREFEIVLNAVHPDHQRGGMYSAMIRAAVDFVTKAGSRRLIISTQLNNYAVQKVWARHGFVHYHSLYTFHKWMDEDG